MPGKGGFYLEKKLLHFSRLLSQFRNVGFVKHFVYLCLFAVRGANMLTANIHMY